VPPRGSRQIIRLSCAQRQRRSSTTLAPGNTAPAKTGSDQVAPIYREPYDEYIGKTASRHARQPGELALARPAKCCQPVP